MTTATWEETQEPARPAPALSRQAPVSELPERPLDLVLLGTVLALLGLGTVEIYASTATAAQQRFGNAAYFLERQVMFLALGISLFSLRGEKDPCLKWAGRATAFGIAAFLIHSATDTNLQSILLVNSLWIWVGILWAAGRISSQGRTG